MKTINFAGVLVLKSGKILMVQEAHPEARGLWSLPLGRVESGEPVEKAAIRETLEETGYSVKISSKKVQINLGGEDFRSTSDTFKHEIRLTIFKAEIIGGDLRPGSDLLGARWISSRELTTIELRGDWIGSILHNLSYN